MPSSRLLAAAIVGLALAALGVSCGLFRGLASEAASPRPFNHAAHLERGLDCATCHEGASGGPEAGMPSIELCMSCHEELDADPAKPRERTVAWFVDEKGVPRWSRFTRQADEVKFSHRDHKADCTTCHAGLDRDTGLLPGMVQRMDSCVACHARDAPAKNDCATCHARLDRTVAPKNHELSWLTMHGVCARQGRGASAANDCALCHQSSSCVACHATQAPGDHHGAWRHRPHGIAASIDRARCQVCHTTDSCVRCHSETAPRSHTAGWNAPRDGHCMSCHVPLQSSPSCFVCHTSTPGHSLAPGMPAWHTPAMNCRSCHAASLQHPDNGDSCLSCHR